MTSPDSSTRIGSSPAPRPEAGGYTPGTILADRYRIVALLGRGGMGEVYRADDLKLGQPVALKFLPADVERDADARARLLAEARNARSIAHPNVCRVYDVGDIDARPFLTTMEKAEEDRGVREFFPDPEQIDPDSDASGQDRAEIQAHLRSVRGGPLDRVSMHAAAGA